MNYSLYCSRKPKQNEALFHVIVKNAIQKMPDNIPKSSQLPRGPMRAKGFPCSIIWWDQSSVWLTQGIQQPQQKATAVERFFKPISQSPTQTHGAPTAAWHWTLPTKRHTSSSESSPTLPLSIILWFWFQINQWQ